MSVKETNFLKWLGGIIAALIITGAIGTFSVLSSVDVMAEKIEHNAKEIKETRVYHNIDADRIGVRINQVQSNQTIMMEDIKDILKNLPQ